MHSKFNLPQNLSRDAERLSQLRFEWTGFVREYTGRNLSYAAKDKLVAFAAIAQRFTTFLGEDYFAGHFQSEMPLGLVWYNDSTPILLPRRTPTWSWTSVDGPVIMLYFTYWLGNTKAISLAKVLDVQVKLAVQDYRYGPVESGYLRISGLLIQCIWPNIAQSNASDCASNGRVVGD